MSAFLFITIARMKDYNYKKYWVDESVIPEQRINADNVQEALKKFVEISKNKFYVEISKNAIREKQPIFADTKNGAVQTGYLITGKVECEAKNGGWTSQYIDLWVQIEQTTFPKF